LAETIENWRSLGCKERLVGVLPVHLFGASVSLKRVVELAEAHGLFVVEDAAQAVGAAVPGFASRRAGAVGDAGCLSFYPTKNLGGLGDGGMVLTSSCEIAQRLRILRAHGAVGGLYRHEVLGLASRLDALQAAALSVKLRYVARWNVRRRQVAEWYGEAFRSTDLVAPRSTRISLPLSAGEAHVFHQYVIRVSGHRDGLRAHLDDRGIGTQVYYPIPLPLQPCLRHLGHKGGDFPEAERASAETLALPIYPELPRSAVETVVDTIADYYRTRC
jgi:dTDP-4-amino-4,6-dideoxygalactose transaminase